jgi:6-hydroxycyclohex-1-ene-1-carbonyl-CoA dehydrogenase
MALTAEAWFLIEPKAPLVRRPLAIGPPADSEAVVAVLANGVCHTDLAYADGSVRPTHALPLVLGHEAVGRVIDVGSSARHLLGEVVIVPAVLPCGECPLCRRARGNACPNQKMPGNDIDGAFATHLLVPARPLIRVQERPGLDRRWLSVVADAVSTAFQATRRGAVAAGDLAMVVGCGGVGAFVVQICAALGAKVIALDVSAERLDAIAPYGADATVCLQGREVREVRDEVQRCARKFGIESFSYKIFECAGVPAAQQQAFALLGRASTMIQVGFTPEKTPLRLSNLMAFDAEVRGTWGCPVEAFPQVLELIYDRKVQLEPFVEVRPMSEVNAVLDDMRAHRLTRRVSLDPHL